MWAQCGSAQTQLLASFCCHRQVCVPQASRHEAALAARLPSVGDLLLGWALDPELPPAMRWVRETLNPGPGPF